MEKKCHRNLRVCIPVHAYAHTCSCSACACFMYGYTYTGMRTHVKVPETMKCKFLTFKTWFWNESHIVWELFQPLFSNYKKPYMVHFQNTHKILWENTRFTRNSESKREFFTKHPQVNSFLIEAFLSLNLPVSRLLIIFYLIVNRLIEENGQNQAKEFCVLRYNVLVPFLFPFPCFDLHFLVFLVCLCYNMPA